MLKRSINAPTNFCLLHLNALGLGPSSLVLSAGNSELVTNM